MTIYEDKDDGNIKKIHAFYFNTLVYFIILVSEIFHPTMENHQLIYFY